MPRGGRVGPPHVTRSRAHFDALDMFKKLIQAVTVADAILLESGDFLLLESGDKILLE